MQHLALPLLCLGGRIAALATAVSAEPTDSDAGDLVSPMLLYGVFVMVLAGLAIIVLATGAVLLTLGMVSFAALVGLFQRRVSSGLRAFHYQACAIVGIMTGSGGFWLLCRLAHHRLDLRYVITVGACSGLCCGVVLAFMLDRLACVIQSRFLNTRDARNLSS